MTKKFTEEEYHKIVDIADKNFEQHKELAVTVNLKNIYDYIFYNETVESKKIKDLNQELALIALPKSRDWAYEQYVEKEKKYLWKSKNADKNGKEVFITVGSEGYPSLETDITWHALTEREIRKWGYNPDMFDREEVE